MTASSPIRASTGSWVAGCRNRFTLAANFSGTAFFGRKTKGSFGGDLVGTAYMWRGLYSRFGVGAHSGMPSSAHGEFAMVPAVGGLAGLGYEFSIAEKVGLSLGADYDARVLTTGGFRQSVMLGLRFVAYLGKGK